MLTDVPSDILLYKIIPFLYGDLKSIANLSMTHLSLSKKCNLMPFCYPELLTENQLNTFLIQKLLSAKNNVYNEDFEVIKNKQIPFISCCIITTFQFMRKNSYENMLLLSAQLNRLFNTHPRFSISLLALLAKDKKEYKIVFDNCLKSYNLMPFKEHGVLETAAFFAFGDNYFKGIMKKLKDRDCGVQEAASQAIVTVSARLSKEDANTVFKENLLPLLKGKRYSSQQKAAAQAIGAVSAYLSPEYANTAFEKLLPLLAQEWAVQAIGAVFARLSKEDVKFAFKKLLSLLKNFCLDKQEAAIQSIGIVSVHLSEGDVKIAFERLRPMLVDRYSIIREAAAQSIGAMSARLSSKDAKAAFEKLLSMLKYQKWDLLEASTWDRWKVIAQTINTMSACLSKEDAKATLKKLRLLLEDHQEWYVQRIVVQAINTISARFFPEDANAASENLLPLLQKKRSSVKKAAIQTIGAVGAHLSKIENVKTDLQPQNENLFYTMLRFMINKNAQKSYCLESIFKEMHLWSRDDDKKNRCLNKLCMDILNVNGSSSQTIKQIINVVHKWKKEHREFIPDSNFIFFSRKSALEILLLKLEEKLNREFIAIEGKKHRDFLTKDCKRIS